MRVRRDGILENQPVSDNVSQGYLNGRYGGGKTAYATEVSTSGDTVLISPGAGNKIRVYWVYAIADPSSTTPPVITLKFGASEFYKAYAISHWEVFEGAVDEDLVVNLDTAENVAVTIHYEELT